MSGSRLNNRFQKIVAHLFSVITPASFVFVFILLGSSFLFAQSADAAAYYMRADGTVTALNKTNATNCNSANTALNIAQHNLATFADGDTIYLCSDGGDYTAILTPPSSGTSLGITYRNVDGQIPVIDSAGIRVQGVLISGKSYITIQGLTIKGGTGNNITLSGTTNNISITGNIFSDLAGSGTRDITLAGGNNLTVTGNTFYEPLTGGYAFINVGATSNLTFNDNILIGPGVGTGRTPSYALYFYLVTNLIFSGNTINGWDLNSTSGKLIYFRDLVSATTSDNIIGSQASPNDGVGYYILSPTVSFTSSGDIIRYQPSDAIYVSGGVGVNFSSLQTTNNSGGSGLYLTNVAVSLTDVTSSNNGVDGFYFSGTSVVTGTGLVANTNSQYGFLITGGDITLTDSSVSGNTLHGLYMYGSSVLDGTNLDSISNLGGGFTIVGGEVTLVDGTADGNGGAAYSISGTGTGILNNETATNNGGGFGFSGNMDITGTNLISSSNASNGFSQTGAAIVDITGGYANNNTEDGYNSSGTGSMTLRKTFSYNNGSVGSASSGDGYTSHDTATIKLYDCVAYGNRKSGYASGSGHTGGTGSIIENCTFYNNYAAEKAGLGGGINIPSAGIWTIKNNITANHDIEIRIGTAAGGTYVINNNLYYASRTANAFRWNGTTYNFADWKTNSGQDANSIGGTTVDP